jgi:hypothetical protein
MYGGSSKVEDNWLREEPKKFVESSGKNEGVGY